jgi:cytochrome c-type biogenesis protein CcmH/NrfG
MTLRDAILFTSGLMTALAVSFATRRWRLQTVSGPVIRTLKWPIFGALILGVAALILYGWPGNSDQSRAASASPASAVPLASEATKIHGGGSLDAMLAQLETRLRGGSGTETDWDLLAQTYDYLGRKADASNARNKHEVASAARPDSDDPQWPLLLQRPADAQMSQPAQQLLSAASRAMGERNYAAARSSFGQLAALGQMGAQSWADYADVVASLNGGQLDGLPQQYIDAALKLDPANEKALWLKASALHQQKRYALAVSTWIQLLALTPAGSTHATTFAGNLAEDQRLAAGSPGQNNTVVAGTALTDSSSAAQVIGEVTLAESLRVRVTTGLTLFIVAKSINSPGVPVAVVRTITGHWPLKFMLDDSLAMLPDRKLSTAGAVMVEARVSQRGAAASQAGDFQSAPAIVDPRSGKPVRLIIDHIIG